MSHLFWQVAQEYLYLGGIQHRKGVNSSPCFSFKLWQDNFIKTSNDQVLLDVRLTDTIQVVKQKIQEKEGILASQQSLMYTGKTLEDDCRLCDHGISDWSTIILSQSFQISVTIVDNQIITRLPQGVGVKLATEVQIPYRGSYSIKYDSCSESQKIILSTST